MVRQQENAENHATFDLHCFRFVKGHSVIHQEKRVRAVKRQQHNGLAWALSALAAAIFGAALVSEWYREFLASRRPDPASGVVHSIQTNRDTTIYLSWRQMLLASPELYVLAGCGLLVACAMLSSKALAEFRWARVVDRQHLPPTPAAGGFRKEVLKYLRASGSDTNLPHKFEF